MEIFINDKGEIWYQSDDLNKLPELLADADSLCGIWKFNTGIDDPFRDCCSWHDKAYNNRAFFEERGWNRQKIDLYFLELMIIKAGNNVCLVERAYAYYRIVRSVAWVFWDRHPAYKKPDPYKEENRLALFNITQDTYDC